MSNKPADVLKRLLVFLALMLACSMPAITYMLGESAKNSRNKKIEVVSKLDSFDRLLDAIYTVESSRGRDKRAGQAGELGVYQITAGAVQDVNELVLRSDVYVHEDALIPSKAKEIAIFYLSHWGKNYRKNTGQEPTSEIYARIWNGGPRGYEKESTIKYWEKIKKELK